ncbi:MAG TPA: hypothetical protein VHS96_02525 [Bacteroidia bacterium]|nr:hypothetical protein [Bacteroidia bacterium]
MKAPPSASRRIPLGRALQSPPAMTDADEKSVAHSRCRRIVRSERHRFLSNEDLRRQIGFPSST